MTERQTVSGAYDKIAAHEDVCAERYRNIHETMSSLRGTVRWMLGILISVSLSVMGWMAIELFQVEVIGHQQPTAIAVSAPTPAPEPPEDRRRR